MKLRRISAAALAAVMMTGTAVTAFADDEINADFKAKVDDLAAKIADLQKQSEDLTAKYGEDVSALPEDQQEAALEEAFGILAAVLELVPSIQEIAEMKDTLNEAEKAYAEENIPGIFDENAEFTPDIGFELPTEPGTTESGTTEPGTTAPTTPGSSDNSDTGVGGIAVLAGTVALAGAAMVIARKRK
ncbi:MAG: NPXTG-anchored protein [Oscillospiraceae bacterium]|nr:NPXTG-anchored protein [Oscillospiraceae bacterium]